MECNFCECRSQHILTEINGKSPKKAFVNVALYCDHKTNVLKKKKLVEVTGLWYEIYTFITTIFLFSVSVQSISDLVTVSSYKGVCPMSWNKQNKTK